MSKTDYNHIYIKKEGAGFVGLKAMVRTPSRSEVMSSVISRILHILVDVLDGKTEQALSADGIAFVRGLLVKPWEEQFEDLAQNLYFGSCMMGCEDPGCREWVDVYGFSGETFCHVSECELIPVEEAPDEIAEPVGTISVQDFIKGRMDSVSKSAELSTDISVPVCNMDEDRQGVFYRGYGTALADILKALTGGDILSDV